MVGSAAAVSDYYHTATMSVCLSPCTVPGLGSSFVLGENEIEMGLGIHGEAGAHRCEVCHYDVLLYSYLYTLLWRVLALHFVAGYGCVCWHYGIVSYRDSSQHLVAVFQLSPDR